MSYNEFYQSQIDESVVENGLKVNGDLIVSGNIIGEIIGAAGDLKTTGDDVNVSASAPPLINQVLKATSATTATWQNDAAGGDVSSSIGSSTDNAITRFDGVTGKLIQESTAILNDNGGITMNHSGGGQILTIDALDSAGQLIVFKDGGVFVGGIDYSYANNNFSFDVTNGGAQRVTNAFTIQSENNDNFIGMGTDAPLSRLHINEEDTTLDVSIQPNPGTVLTCNNQNINSTISNICSSNTPQNRPVLHGIRSRGSNAVPTAVVDGDLITTILGSAYDGSVIQAPCSIDIVADGTPSLGTDAPCGIQFKTGTNALNRISRLTIGSDGDVSIPTGDLELSGNINMNFTYPDSSGVILSDSSGTHKNRLDTLGDNGGAFSFSTNGVYSGAGSAFDHDDATLSYWDFVLDCRSGQDAFRIRRAPIGASTNVVNFLEIDSGGDVSVPTGDLNVTTGKITVGSTGNITGLEQGITLTSWNVAGGNGDLTTFPFANNSTYVGYNAGSGNGDNRNTFVGEDSGGSSGFQNTFVGSASGDNVTGNNNAMIGLTAGNSLLNSSDCVMLGAGSDGLPNTNNQIAIGSGAVCDSSNQCLIGGTFLSLSEIVNGDDGGCNLGSTTHRFKDFYMSGDANIGGAINGILRLSGTVTPRAAGNYAITDDVTGITMKVPDGYIVAKSLVWGIGLDVNSTFTFGGAGVDGGPIVSVAEQLGGVSTRAEILAGKNENSIFNNAIAGLVIKYPFISLELGTTQTAGDIRYIIECIPPP